jgi:lipopolysaccharide exporter
MLFKNLTFNKSFFKDVLNLISGYSISQLIIVAFSPLLTRLYSPEEFGIFFFFITTASLISIVATGGYEKAIVVAANDSDARDLIRFSLILVSLTFLFTTVIFIFLQFSGEKLFDSIEERRIMLLVPVYSFLFGMFRIIQNFNIRKNRFRSISSAFILRSSSQSVVQAGLGAAGMASPGLVLGSCFGQLLSVLSQSGKEKLFRGIFNKDNMINARARAREFSDYPKYRMSSDLINEASIQAPVFILKSVFSNAVTGLYTFPQKILYQPSKFISQAVADVFFNKASRMNSRNRNLGELTFSTYKALLILGVVPYLLILLWGPGLFSFVFGNEWEESGRIAAILSPWMFLVFIGSPVSGIFLVDKKLRLSFVLNISLLVLRLIALFYGALILRDVKSTILLFSVVSSVYWVAIILYSLRFAGVKIGRVLLFTFTVIVIAAAIFVPFKLFIIR